MLSAWKRRLSCKVNWPIKEEQQEQELCALDVELKEFNCEDLDKLDLNGESNEKKKEGEIDISIPGEITDEVSVWKTGQDKTGSSCSPAATKDELDLHLSQSYFFTPISNSETQEIFELGNQTDNDSMTTSSSEDFAVVDDCIDQLRQIKTVSIASLI